jgi:kynurenine 3-monooxygenase
MLASSRLKLLPVGVLLAVLLISLFYVDKQQARSYIINIIEWLHSLGALGILIFISCHAAAVVICFPGTVIFELGAGLLFSFFFGVMLVLSAKTLGGCLSFFLGRTLLRDWVLERLRGYPRFQLISERITQDSLRFAFLLRISPIPSWMNNYGLAVTSIPFSSFFFATAIGGLPTIAQNVYIGSLVQSTAALASASSLPDPSATTIQTVMGFLGLAAMIILSRQLYRYASLQTGLTDGADPLAQNMTSEIKHKR